MSCRSDQKQESMSDHDLLLRIDQNLIDVCLHIEDHEKRIRIGERFDAALAGVGLVLSAIGGWILLHLPGGGS